jgi:ABC-2 type transport system ATP-binding protein
MLRLERVTRGYNDHPVLREATLALKPGRVTCLVGGNGAGKTTLLRVAVGLLEPEAGSVSLAGLDATGDRRAYQRRLGYVPAGNGGLYARLKVSQHLRLWSDLALVPVALRAARVSAAMSSFALDDLASSRVDRLSTGQRQRVRLAMGFLHEPDVVLLDEPHASLDDAGLAALSLVLDQVVDRGGAVMWCAPKRGGVELRADDNIVLRDGRLWDA